jgi:Flp pilus assembly protein CpaB
MNVKALVPLVAGLGIGGLALMLGINTLKKARAGQQPAAKIQIWAAKENIPRGLAIQEQMLKPLPFPAGLAPQGAFKKKEDLIGRVPQLVAPAGLPILESMLSPPGTKPGIYVKSGYRAVAVKIDAGSGVDYHLEPGCFVDVVGSFKVRRDNRSETIAKTLVENAEVAAVGPWVSPTSPETGEPKDRGRTVRAVTIFVKPDQVPKLLLAEQQGRIKLSLRGLEDNQTLENEQWLSEGALTGDPAESAPEQTEAKGSATGWFRGLFAKFVSPSLAAAQPDPALQRWVLRIYRADKEEVVQFKSVDSHERVDGKEQPGAVQSPSGSPALPPPASPPADGDSENQGAEMEPEEPTG